MPKIFKPIYLIYQVFILIPLVVIATALTSIFTILFSYCKKNPLLKTIPPKWWGKVVCFLSSVKVEIEGLDQLEAGKSYILVANHQSMFDIFVVYGWINRPFSWILKKELKKMPLLGKACDAAGHVFVDRKNPTAAKKSIQEAEQKLSNGNSLVVFPEGTRSSDGKVAVFKRGAFNIAANIHLPIVPITITGAYEILSKDSMLIKPGKIKMIIHKPIDNTISLNEQEARKLANSVRDIIIDGFSKK